MPITVSLPSRNVELEFPDSMTEQEIAAAIEQEYPRSGEDVAYEVEQAKTATIEGRDLLNPFEGMSNDDYALFRKHLTEKKTSLGDALGIAADTFGTIVSEVGKAAGATGGAVLGGEFGAAGESAVEGMVAGTVGLADIADKIFQPARTIPSKEEFLKRKIETGKPAGMVRGDFGVEDVAIPSFRPATEADYAALIEQEKQRDAEATNRLYAMEATLRGAPIEEIARGFQYVDPTLLASLGGTAAAKLAGKTLFKGSARTAATQAATTARTAPGAIGQAALAGVERAAGAVETVAGLPSRAITAVGNVAENIAPGTGLPTRGAAVATTMMGGAGIPLAGAAATEKAAEVVGSVARAARQEASRAGLLERAAMDAGISPAARKVAAGLAQIQPGISAAGRLTAQAAKEGAAGAVVGAGLGYLAEGNLEGAAAGAGAGAAIGGLSGTLRSSFDLGREMLGKSTSRTREQATGDLNRFLGERPEVEQAAWGETINRLVQQVGPERAASQVDAMRIAEANGAKVRVATPDEMKQWQNPGWLNVDGMEVVLNPSRILGDTASHETAHVLFSSVINRAFRPEIETAIFGLADPVNGEIVRPGLFDDADLAKVADQIGDSYGTNTQAANEFRGYANVLRNSTDSASLQNARTRIADEMTAAYTGRLFNRIRPGRFNPDRLPLAYRKALNALEDGILDKFRSVLFEKGMDLGFDAPSRTFRDSKGKPIRIPELDAIVKRAMAKKGTKEAAAPTAKPDLIPTKPADRVIWARSYGGARGILNDDGTPKSEAQVNAEAAARWQDMTQRMAALPENERIGIEFSRDKTGKTVMTAKGQISPTAINAILDSGALDPSAKAVLRDVLVAMQDPNKATFDTRYYGVYTRGRGGNRMVAGVKSASQNEILPYSVEMNSKDGVIIRAVDMTKVRERLETALNKPQFKSLYGNPADALKDFNRYLENITQVNPVESAMLLGGGEKGAKKRNLFYDALGFRLRNGESLVNTPESAIGKSQNTIKSYRVERFAKLQKTGFAFPFEEATSYERVMRNFQPDAFTRETLPNGETMTNPDGYRILKKTGSKLFRVYDDKGELLGTSSTEQAAMRKAQSDFATKATKEEKQTRFQAEDEGKGTTSLKPLLETDFSTKWDSYPKTRGELTKQKIIAALKGATNRPVSQKRLAQFVASYDNAQDLLDHAYYHGTQNFVSTTLKPSITLSDRQAEQMGGGGYGEKYWAISLSKSKRKSEAFAGQSRSVRVHPVLLKKSAKVIELPGVKDAADLDDYIVDLWKNQVDAVWIGGGEQELAVINPKAIVFAQDADTYTVFGGFKSEDFTLDKAQEVFSKASEFVSNPSSVETLKLRFQPVSPEQDAAYLRAAQAGDIETARKLVIEAAKNADYFSHGDFRDAHRAPSGPAGTNADVMNGDAEPTLIQVAKGVHNQPSDYFDPRVGPRYYMYQDKAGMESLRALRTAMDKIQQGKKASVTVFRAVPIEIKGTKLENKDWVTPSKTYAISHGEARFGEGQYRIIKESVKAENLFWDGNDIREWGKDDSQDYFYRNVKNNIKSADPITYDDQGNVIPLSQRFNIESPDIRFQPDAASPSILNGSNGTRIIKSPSGKFRVYSVTGTLLGIRDTEQAAQKLATK
jgi:hypothetical protein